MNDNAIAASKFLKAISHEGRLKILCCLLMGEKSVTEIQEALSMRQPAASQQISRLRLEGLISCRRDGKSLYYKITDPRVEPMIAAVFGICCSDDDSQ